MSASRSGRLRIEAGRKLLHQSPEFQKMLETIWEGDAAFSRNSRLQGAPAPIDSQVDNRGIRYVVSRR
jgi:hypothetical protein